MVPIIFCVIIGAMGLFVVINPKAATKKANRENEAAVKKVRKLGCFQHYFLFYRLWDLIGNGLNDVGKRSQMYPVWATDKGGLV